MMEAHPTDAVHSLEEGEPEFKPTASPEQVAAALAEVRGRSFSGRHPELGKMVKCHFCGLRHRVNERKCEQQFTYKVRDKNGRVYERFREKTEEEKKDKSEVEQATLVPDLRTAISLNRQPTIKQFLGAAQFTKKRWHPHHSKVKLQFIERTRVVYDQLKFVWNLLGTPNTTASKLQRARVYAARQLRKEREFGDCAKRRQQDLSRRINRGLVCH